MKFKGHTIITAIVLVILSLIFRDITVTSILIPILFIADGPDVDLKFNSHRNIFFHSLFLPIITLIFIPSILTIMITFTIGLHLLCDVSFKKVGGTYCVKLYHKAIGGYWFATIWFISNFVASIIILSIWLVIV